MSAPGKASAQPLEYHVQQFVPNAKGEELALRIALLKARDYAGMIRCKPIGEIARDHAIAAQEVAEHYFHNSEASPAELQVAVDYCRHLVQAAFLAEHLEAGV